MIEILKVQDTIYENIEERIFIPTAFNENGEPTGFEPASNPIIPQTEDELREVIKDTVLWLASRKVNQWLNQNGYHSIGDLVFYAQQNVQEAADLLNNYRNFDRAVWEFINSLSGKTYDELLEIAKTLRTFVDSLVL